MSHDAALEAELLTLDFRAMYVQWGKSTPPRTGMHASAVLDKEFCAREQVLLQISPEQGEARTWNHWDWKKSIIFENGWRLHQRWQDVFRKCGNVVYSLATSEQVAGSSHGKVIDGKLYLPELDLTHYDADRNLYFSPDAIIQFGGQKYVVEIKGLKQEAYQGLSDDLETSCSANETVEKAREQVNLYMHLLGLDRGIILVENKSNQDFRLWIVEYEQERAWPYTNRMQEVKGRTLLAKQHGRAKLPLRRCQSKEESRAKACPMRAVCFQQEESEEW